MKVSDYSLKYCIMIIPHKKLLKTKLGRNNATLKSNASLEKKFQPKKMSSTAKNPLTMTRKQVEEEKVASSGDSSDDDTLEDLSTEGSSDFSSLDDSFHQSREFDPFKDIYYDCNSENCDKCGGAQEDQPVVEEYINLEDNNVVMEESNMDVDSKNVANLEMVNNLKE